MIKQSRVYNFRRSYAHTAIDWCNLLCTQNDLAEQADQGVMSECNSPVL